MASTSPTSLLPPGEPVDFDCLLRRKNLDPLLFATAFPDLTSESPLGEHGRFLYQTIYRHPYPDARPGTISRYHHGMAHVSRVALYVSVFANLYRKYEIPGADAITPERVKLLQIAALFHDAGREAEGTDHWDHESALMLYNYLRRRLHVPPEEAKLIAEATANKDLSPKGYFFIRETPEGVMTSGFDPTITPENHTKNVYEQLIHDADCLDIQRVRPHFKGRFLDFEQHIEQMPPGERKQQAIAIRAELICEVRSLIALQGDAYGGSEPDKKQKYESAEGCDHIFEESLQFGVLGSLGDGLYGADALEDKPPMEMRPWDPASPLLGANMNAAMREGRILARGIGVPTESHTGPDGHPRTGADIDLQKTMRTRGIATPTQKPNRLEKEGNPIRSFTMLGYGSDIFTDVGFLALRDDTAISFVAKTNSYTGTGKKSGRSELDKSQRQDTASIAGQMDALYEQLRLGGDSSMVSAASGGTFESTHNEILMDAYRYDAIYYSNDPNFYNRKSRTDKQGTDASLLEAVYLRQEYARHYTLTREKYQAAFGETEGAARFVQRFGGNPWLPVFEYSKQDNVLREVPEALLLDDHFLIKKWQRTILAYWREELYLGDSSVNDLREESLEDIKTFALYGRLKVACLPAVRHYPPEVRERLNQWILQARNREIEDWEQDIRDKLHSGRINFNTIGYLLASKSPLLCAEFREHALAMFPAKIASETDLTKLRDLRTIIEKFGIAADMEPLLVQRAFELTLPDIRKAELPRDLLKCIETITRVDGRFFSEPLKEAVANQMMALMNRYNLAFGMDPGNALDVAMQVLSFLEKRHFRGSTPTFNVLYNIRIIKDYTYCNPVVWAERIVALENMLPEGFSRDECLSILSGWHELRHAGMDDTAIGNALFSDLLEKANGYMQAWLAEVVEKRDSMALRDKVPDFGHATMRQVIKQLAESPEGRGLLDDYLAFIQAHWDGRESNLYIVLLILSLPPRSPSASTFFKPVPDSSEAIIRILDLMDGKEEVFFSPDEIATLKQGVLGTILGDQLDELPLAPDISPENG